MLSKIANRSKSTLKSNKNYQSIIESNPYESITIKEESAPKMGINYNFSGQKSYRNYSKSPLKNYRDPSPSLLETQKPVINGNTS